MNQRLTVLISIILSSLIYSQATQQTKSFEIFVGVDIKTNNNVKIVNYFRFKNNNNWRVIQKKCSKSNKQKRKIFYLQASDSGARLFICSDLKEEVKYFLKKEILEKHLSPPANDNNWTFDRFLEFTSFILTRAESLHYLDSAGKFLVKTENGYIASWLLPEDESIQGIIQCEFISEKKLDHYQCIFIEQEIKI